MAANQPTMHQQRSQHLSPTLNYQQQTNHYNNQPQNAQYNNYYKHNMMKHNNGTLSADVYHQSQQHQAAAAQQRQSQNQHQQQNQNQNQYTMNPHSPTSATVNLHSHSPNLHAQQHPNQPNVNVHPQNQRQQNYLKPSNIAINHRIHQQPSIGSPSSTAHHSYSYGTIQGQPRENTSRLSLQVSSPKGSGTTHEISNLGPPSLLTAQRSQGSRSAPFADINTMNEHNQQNNYYNNNQVQNFIPKSLCLCFCVCDNYVIVSVYIIRIMTFSVLFLIISKTSVNIRRRN